MVLNLIFIRSSVRSFFHVHSIIVVSSLPLPFVESIYLFFNFTLPKPPIVIVGNKSKNFVFSQTHARENDFSFLGLPFILLLPFCICCIICYLPIVLVMARSPHVVACWDLSLLPSIEWEHKGTSATCLFQRPPFTIVCYRSMEIFIYLYFAA